MILRDLQIVNYKNYEDVHIEFHHKFNVITGLNGQGKTNLIDAIYYLGLTRSFFFNVDTHNYRHGIDFFRLVGTFEIADKKEKIVAKVKKRTAKVFERNSKKYEKLVDHIGFAPIVMIAPKDQSLISEGSEERRKLIDSTISQLDAAYLRHLIEYKYVLKQRNQLLKNHAAHQRIDLSLLDIYDQKLVENGQYIFQKRKEYLDFMSPIFLEKYKMISDHQENCLFQYKSKLHETDFATLLKDSREKDKILGRTSTGIHKDDIVFFNEDNMIKHVGSQGQQKSFILALKLAQFQLILNQTNRKPIILLDDIFDKLDSKRVLQLIHLLHDQDLGQIFITDTEINRLKSIFEELNYAFSLFEVKENQVLLKD